MSKKEKKKEKRKLVWEMKIRPPFEPIITNQAKKPKPKKEDKE